MPNLAGKSAIVTGAGRGIGKAIALKLASLGANVVLNDWGCIDGAEEAVRQIEATGGSAIAFRADISSVEQIGGLVTAAIGAFGGVDILVNNAAVDPTEDFLNVTESFWEQVVHTNLKGTFFCAQACAREMMKVRKGKIINISSVHGQLTMPRYAVYASTKGGINAFTRQLAIDLAKHGIQVNAVAPGAIEVEKFYGKPWFDTKQFGEYIPTGRIGQPQDVAEAVAFLASEASDFVTGQVLTVDGGSSACLFLPVDVR
jgi:glucose 1-dehydrogenase/3-oxoacyl-[acyl-carrier protein] reductase